MEPADLTALLERVAKRAAEEAAEAGAKRALASVGLHDEKAADDVRELRDWLRNVQSLKSEFVRAVGRAIGVAFVAAIGAAAALWTGFRGH